MLHQSSHPAEGAFSMKNNAGAKYILAYEVGFAGEVNWDRPVLFALATIDRIDKSESGNARFTVSESAVEPVEFVTRASFDEVVERLGAIR
jgi:hypothetical protein